MKLDNLIKEETNLKLEEKLILPTFVNVSTLFSINLSDAQNVIHIRKF